jgi:hypothetical protein
VAPESYQSPATKVLVKIMQFLNFIKLNPLYRQIVAMARQRSR